MAAPSRRVITVARAIANRSLNLAEAGDSNTTEPALTVMEMTHESEKVQRLVTIDSPHVQPDDPRCYRARVIIEV